MTFRAPTAEIGFSLEHVAEAWRLREAGGWPEFDADLTGAVLEAAGQFADAVLAPLNRAGDLAGATYADGTVTAAPGFADAYRRFAEGGWTGLAADPAHGGQGLPKALKLAAYESFHAANMAFGLCPMLSLASIEALQSVGTPDQRSTYLTKLVSGEWTGAMVLTEPQAGSDLAAIRATAVPNGDGTYALTGQKIFITWGDHDATDNIVHLVLARLPDAPAGSKGISLFLAPKVMADGRRNAFRPVGVEHKLGIHASPTCVMAYEGATAELVGRPNQGLAHMFIMMNAARLAVGVQGVAIAERAYQQALGYARERRQGRSVWTGEASAPILDLPDVRRMLGVMKARVAAARGLCLHTAVAAGLAERGPESERAKWKAREDLLVPIAKAWSTDTGVAVASTGVQVHGGMGFIEETGAAQHYRDARIAPIYEGTNGIQAMDLVGRKLSSGGAEAVRELTAEMRELADEDPVLRWLEPASIAIDTATDWLMARKGQAGREGDVLVAADGYLKLLGEGFGGLMLARAVGAARKAGDAAAHEGLFEIYAANVLSAGPGRMVAITQGDKNLKALAL